ncbi:hypothetical protein GCM10009654_20980 [Streptomyces hebeiensis]|uniref:Uncharacterized protein n=1 Tax=Streptomyces hebeiensis TaxID=229486 RepID=A0ABP4FEA5_9ACTN
MEVAAGAGPGPERSRVGPGPGRSWEPGLGATRVRCGARELIRLTAVELSLRVPIVRDSLGRVAVL